MSRPSIRLRNVCCAVFFSILIAPTAANADLVTNWKLLSGGAGTSGLNTSSPVFGDGTANNAIGSQIGGKFSSTRSLAVGETLSVSGELLLTGGSSTIPDTLLRFGVFNDGGRFDLGSQNNWTAGWLHSVSSETPDSSADLWRARTNGSFISTSGNAFDLNAIKSGSGLIDGDSTAIFTWSMDIERNTAGTVNITSAFAGGDSSNVQNYFEGNVTTSNFDFTAVGWFFSNSTFVGIDQATFSNVDASGAVPEPSSCALFACCGLGLLVRRRNARR